MRGILFDLDGTLLDLDLNAFLRRYFSALSGVIAEMVSSEDLQSAVQAVSTATEAMMRPHPGVTNQQVFREEYLRLTGVDILEKAHVFERFYEETFPLLGDGCAPAEGAHEALAAAERLGMRIAVATNPIFPRKAVEHRLAWAGVDLSRVHAITTYECMHACKPAREYFRETAEMIGVSPEECLMVGDDPLLDMAASDVGMTTFYVGPGTHAHANYSGSLVDLPWLLERLSPSDLD